MDSQENLLKEINNLLSNIESKSWICNYLQTKGIIDNQEFITLSRFGAWVLEHHPNVMRAYWSYLDKLMKKYDTIESVETATLLFRPWVEETIQFIKSNQMNRAYNSFCLMVINLTEQYNKKYLLFTKSELEIYLGLKKSIENSRKYSYYI
tara:strand:+ start:491 stop:943 length:453 start_codon:yes stop_codon:yes gene_type:complete